MAELENMSLNNTDAGELNQTEVDTSKIGKHHSIMIAAGFSLLICILGMIGNSLVFWYLSFRIKRTKYTVYIINLVIADLIFLIFFSIVMCMILIIFSDQGPNIDDPDYVLFRLEILFNLGMDADMFLLTAISVERCLSVLYPVWYHCNRPKAQSGIVCLSIWGLSILMTLVDKLGCPADIFDTGSMRCTAVQAIISVLIFAVAIPIMVVSSLILLIRIRKTSKQCQAPKLFIIIVASVIIFLISVAPVRLLWLLVYLKALPSSFSSPAFYFICYMLISINSSINPFIYFLVGRQNMQGAQEYLIRALKKVFVEGEEEGRMEIELQLHEVENTSDSNISNSG